MAPTSIFEVWFFWTSSRNTPNISWNRSFYAWVMSKLLQSRHPTVFNETFKLMKELQNIDYFMLLSSAFWPWVPCPAKKCVKHATCRHIFQFRTGEAPRKKTGSKILPTVGSSNWALRFAVSHAGPEPRYLGPGCGRDSGEAVKQLQVWVTCFNNPTFGER